MADMNVRIDNDQFTMVIAKSIIEQMTPEARDKIITDAIAALNKPTQGMGYGAKSETPLQRAFNQAVTLAVQDLVVKIVRADDGESPLGKAIHEKVESWMNLVEHDVADYDIDRIIAMGLVAHYREKAASRDY